MKHMQFKDFPQIALLFQFRNLSSRQLKSLTLSIFAYREPLSITSFIWTQTEVKSNPYEQPSCALILASTSYLIFTAYYVSENKKRISRAKTSLT